MGMRNFGKGLVTNRQNPFADYVANAATRSPANHPRGNPYNAQY